ncbi:NACHT, LRR and PYD domains-containing protein 1 homolog isoform X2 [Sardina pilchardus]|uniref:NACHT, LRR and PYD domains-containing protein 1 homolog isoform X2 n=1 Tax=Sardina pilchardus TaxID=27697 RepID=UPI002E150C89
MENDYAWIVDSHRAEFIQRVTLVMPLADRLRSQGMLHAEAYSEIHTAKTSQEKMRELYKALDSGGDRFKSAFYCTLKEHDPQLIQDFEDRCVPTSRKRLLSTQSEIEVKKPRHPESGSSATDCQSQDCRSVLCEYKQCLCEEYETVEDYRPQPGEEVLLEERFTEPHIVQKHREQSEREKEVRSRGETSFGARASQTYRSTSIEQLFCPFDRGRTPKAVILQGHSGHGKSFAAQKIMYDWACGRLYREHFDLVFHLRCKELNLLTGEMSMVELLSRSYRFTPMITQVLHHHPHRVLFLIDGFDELSLSLDGARTLPRSDLLSPAPLEDNISALLMGRILSKSSLLVTTRSTASDRLSKLLKRPQRFAEILGFSERGVREYFGKFFHDEVLSTRLYECVRSNETLYTACFIPVICWIVCTVFKEQSAEDMDVTRRLETSTSIFVYFVSTLLKHHCQQLDQPGLVLKLLKSLSQLAERGMLKQQVLFDEKSVSEAVSDPVTGPFLCKFLLKKKTILQTMFSFMHLSFQEFFTALHYTVIQEEETHRKLDQMLGSICQGMRISIIVIKPKQRYNYHLLPIIQFLLGLANNSVRTITLESHTLTVPLSVRSRLEDWFLRVMKETSVTTSDRARCSYLRNPWGNNVKLSLLHCLYELNEEAFVSRAMALWEEVEFTDIPLRRTDCWVLRYCLLCCPCIKSLRLTGCAITAEKMMMLQPVLCRSEKLSLQVEELSDGDVGDLLSALGEGNVLRYLSVSVPNLADKDSVSLCSSLSLRRHADKHLNLSAKHYASSSAQLLSDSESSSPQAEAALSSMSLTLPPSPQLQPTDCTAFLQTLHSVRGLTESSVGFAERVDALLSCLLSLASLKKLVMVVSCLTTGWASRVLTLVQACSSLKEITVLAGRGVGLNLSGDGFLLEDGLKLLRSSPKRPDCSLTVIGWRCNKPCDQCTNLSDSKLPCNRHVQLSINGESMTEKAQWALKLMHPPMNPALVLDQLLIMEQNGWTQRSFLWISGRRISGYGRARAGLYL